MPGYDIKPFSTPGKAFTPKPEPNLYAREIHV